MKIYFTDTKFLEKRAIRRVAEVALKRLNQPTDFLEMSISVVSPEEIQRLNNDFRNIDKVTDVLSFPTIEAQREVISVEDSADVNPESGKLNLGDIVICRSRAEEQAELYGHSLKREMCFLSLHGLLHLLGYDHVNPDDEKQMLALQTEILNTAHITRD